MYVDQYAYVGPRTHLHTCIHIHIRTARNSQKRTAAALHFHGQLLPRAVLRAVEQRLPAAIDLPCDTNAWVDGWINRWMDGPSYQARRIMIWTGAVIDAWGRQAE